MAHPVGQSSGKMVRKENDAPDLPRPRAVDLGQSLSQADVFLVQVEVPHLVLGRECCLLAGEFANSKKIVVAGRHVSILRGVADCPAPR